MKRIWVVLLIAGLLAWAAPAGAASAGEDVRWEILSPAEKQTVSGMVDVTFPPFKPEGPFGVLISIAPGFDAKVGFRDVWQEAMFLLGTTPPTLRFATDGFGSGPYTMRVTLDLYDGDGATDHESVQLAAYRNFVIEAPDRAPKLSLDLADVVAGTVPANIRLVDDDLAHWTLQAVDHRGQKWVLASGDITATLQGPMADEPWSGWPTATMIQQAKEKTPNLGVQQPPATLDLSQLKDGEYTFCLWAVDLFGNESVLEKKVMVQKLTIESPTDRQSMASPVQVRFGADEPFWQAEVEVARGFDATTGFRRVTRLQRPADMSGVTSMSFDWKVAGLSGGPYTLRVRLNDPKTEAVEAEGTRNIVLNAPDYSPVLNLDVPTVLNGATRIVASIVDEDAHHWKLDIVDGEGRERTLTVGKNESMAGVLTSWIPERSEATQRKTIPLPDAYDLTGLPDGAYTVRLYAVDAFGNESVLERKTVVEPRAPEPGIVSVAAYSGVGLNLRWEGATDNSGIAGYRVFLQEAGERRLLADLGPEARQYAQPLPPGQYGVVWQVVDRTGQVTELDPMGFEVRTGAVSIWQRGRFLSSDVPAFVEEGRTWVPLRLFGEAMGYEVFWDNDRQVATLRNNQTGRMLMMALGEDTLQVQEGPVQVKVAIGAAPRLINGRVMVPLRALVEALGARVNWVQATQTVEIE